MNPQAFETLEFNQLRQLVRRHAQTDIGRARVNTLQPFDDLDLLSRALAQACEATQLRARGVRFAFDGVADPSETIARLKIEGTALDPLAILELVSLCNAALDARGAILAEREGLPALFEIVATLSPALKQLITAITKKILPNGELDDRASPELARIRQEIGQGPNARDWSQVMISEVTQPQNRRYQAIRVDAAARVAGKDTLTFVLDLLWEEQVQVEAIYFTMSEDNLRAILRKPYVMIGSDSGCRAHHGPLSAGRPHPRTFGTFARALGHYARDARLFDLPTGIRKMTSEPCRRMGLADRGWIRPGFAADIVLFDPDRIRDTATYEEPIRYPAGLHMVLVNGIVAVESGEHTGARAGRILRRTSAPS